MKTKKEVKNELEDRSARLPWTWVFGFPKDFDYEKGFIDALKWVLGRSEQT